MAGGHHLSIGRNAAGTKYLVALDIDGTVLLHTEAPCQKPLSWLLSTLVSNGIPVVNASQRLVMSTDLTCVNPEVLLSDRFLEQTQVLNTQFGEARSFLTLASTQQIIATLKDMWAQILPVEDYHAIINHVKEVYDRVLALSKETVPFMTDLLPGEKSEDALRISTSFYSNILADLKSVRTTPTPPSEKSASKVNTLEAVWAKTWNSRVVAHHSDLPSAAEMQKSPLIQQVAKACTALHDAYQIMMNNINDICTRLADSDNYIEYYMSAPAVSSILGCLLSPTPLSDPSAIYENCKCDFLTQLLNQTKRPLFQAIQQLYPDHQIFFADDNGATYFPSAEAMGIICIPAQLDRVDFSTQMEWIVQLGIQTLGMEKFSEALRKLAAQDADTALAFLTHPKFVAAKPDILRLPIILPEPQRSLQKQLEHVARHMTLYTSQGASRFSIIHWQQHSGSASSASYDITVVETNNEDKNAVTARKHLTLEKTAEAGCLTPSPIFTLIITDSEYHITDLAANVGISPVPVWGETETPIITSQSIAQELRAVRTIVNSGNSYLRMLEKVLDLLDAQRRTITGNTDQDRSEKAQLSLAITFIKTLQQEVISQQNYLDQDRETIKPILEVLDALTPRANVSSGSSSQINTLVWNIGAIATGVLMLFAPSIYSVRPNAQDEFTYPQLVPVLEDIVDRIGKPIGVLATSYALSLLPQLYQTLSPIIKAALGITASNSDAVTPLDSIPASLYDLTQIALAQYPLNPIEQLIYVLDRMPDAPATRRIANIFGKARDNLASFNAQHPTSPFSSWLPKILTQHPAQLQDTIHQNTKKRLSEKPMAIVNTIKTLADTSGVAATTYLATNAVLKQLREAPVNEELTPLQITAKIFAEAMLPLVLLAAILLLVQGSLGLSQAAIDLYAGRKATQQAKKITAAVFAPDSSRVPANTADPLREPLLPG